MNSITTMMLVAVLVSTAFVTLTSTAPITYNAYGRRQIAEKPEVLLWVDQTVPNLENEIFESGNNPASTVTRTKRIGSLSIVNSLDVLRQRVLLELARRKALQDQRQIDANRRFLDSIGKRSVPTYGEGMPKSIEDRTRNGLEYAVEQQNNDRSLAAERIPGRTQDWFEGNDPVFREPDDQMRRIQPNEIRLL